MYSKIRKWLTSQPATKAGWVGAITGIASLIITLFVVYQISQAIKSSQESVQISQKSLNSSIEPSIKVTFPELLQSLNIQIQNTSPYVHKNASFYAIRYNVSNGKVINRNQPSSIFSDVKYFEPKQFVTLDFSNVFQNFPFENYNKGNYFSLIIVLHRESDNKRFVKIEPFIAGLGSDNNYYIFDLQYGNQQSSDGEPQTIIEILSEIQRIEKILFRDDGK